MDAKKTVPQAYFPVKITDILFIQRSNRIDCSKWDPNKINAGKEDSKSYSEQIVILNKEGVRYEGPLYRKIRNLKLFLQYDHNPVGLQVAYEALKSNGEKVFNVAGEEVKGESLEKIIRKYMF